MSVRVLNRVGRLALRHRRPVILIRSPSKKHLWKHILKPFQLDPETKHSPSFDSFIDFPLSALLTLRSLAFLASLLHFYFSTCCSFILLLLSSSCTHYVQCQRDTD